MDISNYYGMKYEAPKDEQNLGKLCHGSFLGIEVELENMPGAGKPSRKWDIHADGSLRNNGIEFVSSRPLWTGDAQESLTELEDYITKNGYRPSLSARTSVHVHMDVRPLTMKQLYHLFMIYAIFEKSLFAVYAPKRESNHFCVPLHSSEEIQNCIRTLQNNTFREFDNQMNNIGGRYGALNLLAIAKYGTLEFRHHGGEYRAAELSEWLDALLSLRKFAIEFDGNPLEFFNVVSQRSFEHLAYRVFPVSVAVKLCKANLHENILSGIRIAQSIHFDRKVFALPPHIKAKSREKSKVPTINFQAAEVNGARFIADDDLDINWFDPQVRVRIPADPAPVPPPIPRVMNPDDYGAYVRDGLDNDREATGVTLTNHLKGDHIGSNYFIVKYVGGYRYGNNIATRLVKVRHNTTKHVTDVTITYTREFLRDRGLFFPEQNDQQGAF